MNEHVDYVAKKPSSSTKFLWWCAGADEKILQYSSYSDHVKYVGIGGVVLATGFMAALSMGFAIHTIFETWWITITIALAWAIIVFNLDRFIVSSTGKGDGDSSISLSELGNATPRLIMAILLGLTISAPLETKIFSKEIEREWVDVKDKLAIAKQNELDQQLNDRGEAAEITKKMKGDSILYSSLQTELTEKEKQLGELKCAGDRKTCTSKGHWAVIEAKDRIKNTYDSVGAVLSNGSAELIKAQDYRKHFLDSATNAIKNDTAGFLDQVMMLEVLSSKSKEVKEIDPKTLQPTGNLKEVVPPAFWAIWLVRLLFMIIEIAPVLLKLMLIKSPYDYMTENVNSILEAKQGISLRHLPDQYSQIHKLKENFNPQRIVSIVEHQNKKEQENAIEAIDRFAEQEKQAIAKDPSGFIKPDDGKA
jgi:hypothetical protein